MQFNDTEIPIPEYRKIEKELKDQGRSVTWMANKLDLCYQHTRRLIKGIHPIPEKTLQKMQELLHSKY